MEYTDAYKPWKYGIILKEKIVYHPADNIMATISVRLLKNGKDFENVKRSFKLELLDNGKPIYSKIGLNRINIGHILFRANQGLPEASDDPNVEIKHNYVI